MGVTSIIRSVRKAGFRRPAPLRLGDAAQQGERAMIVGGPKRRPCRAWAPG